MKRQPVKKGALVGAAYPNVNDPQFRALLKRLAKGTAMAGLAGVMGLAVPACDLFPSDKAPEQDVGPADTSEGWEVVGIDTIMPSDVDSRDWTLVGEDVTEPTDVDVRDWALLGDPATDTCTTEITVPADIQEDWPLAGGESMPDSKPE